jgi:hypothetical protein
MYLQHVWRAHVNFCDDDEDGNAEGQGQAQMLLGHANDTRVGSDHQHTKIWNEKKELKINFHNKKDPNICLENSSWIKNYYVIFLCP